MRRCVTVGLLGWILWFTQQEFRQSGPSGPVHWNLLGSFETQATCEKSGQGLIEQLGRLSPEKDYTRGTAWMSMVDTRPRDGHYLYTVMYCISDDVDPRLVDKSRSM